MTSSHKMLYIIPVICFVVVAASVLGMFGGTLGWFQVSENTSATVSLTADRVLSINFKKGSSDVTGDLRPAVAKPNAVRDGRNLDVLDANNPWIETPAQKLHYSTQVTYVGISTVYLDEVWSVALEEEPLASVDKAQFYTTFMYKYADTGLPVERTVNGLLKVIPQENALFTSIQVDISLMYANVDELVDPNLLSGDIQLNLWLNIVERFVGSVYSTSLDTQENEGAHLLPNYKTGDTTYQSRGAATYDFEFMSAADGDTQVSFDWIVYDYSGRAVLGSAEDNDAIKLVSVHFYDENENEIFPDQGLYSLTRNRKIRVEFTMDFYRCSAEELPTRYGLGGSAVTDRFYIVVNIKDN